MSRIIFSTINGGVTREAVMPRSSMFRTKIYMDDPINLIGFRRRLPYHEDRSGEILTEYIEIEHFMGMLYEGLPKAFDILFMSEDHVEHSSLEFDMLKRNSKIFLNTKLLVNLLMESKKRLDCVSDPDVHAEKKDEEFSVKMFEFNKQNAYICLRNLMLAINVIKHESYEITKSNEQVLQGVIDGLFTLKGITQGYEDYLGKVEKLQEKLEIPVEPDLDTINDLLLEIRNVEIIDNNIALAE